MTALLKWSTPSIGNIVFTPTWKVVVWIEPQQRRVLPDDHSERERTKGGGRKTMFNSGERDIFASVYGARDHAVPHVFSGTCEQLYFDGLRGI
ncbi:hypothetical protein MRX96_042022 [Rhipicephalus microplus]